MTGSAGDRATHRERVFADLDSGEMPRPAEVGGRWAPLTAEGTYLDGPHVLVDGLVAAR